MTTPSKKTATKAVNTAKKTVAKKVTATKKVASNTATTAKATASKKTAQANQTLESLLYTGVGLAKNVSTNIETRVKEMMKNTKPAEKEGKVLIEKFVADALKARNAYEEKVNDVIEKAMKAFTMPKSKELNSLKTRIAELEKELQGEANTTYAKTAKNFKKVTNQLETKATAVASELQDAAESIGKIALKSATNIAKKINK